MVLQIHFIVVIDRINLVRWMIILFIKCILKVNVYKTVVIMNNLINHFLRF